MRKYQGILFAALFCFAMLLLFCNASASGGRALVVPSTAGGTGTGARV